MYRPIYNLLLLALLLTGCFYGPDQKTGKQSIDPPPKEVERAYEQAVQTSLEKKEKSKTVKNGVELYFLSNTGHVVPYTIHIPNVKGIAKETLMYMVKGGPGEKSLPKGFSGILPSGTKVLGIDIRNRTATIDFSKEFLNYRPEMEEKMLSAVTWTLTGFPSVEKVSIRVNGKDLETMPHRKTAAQGLTRKQGINVEVAEGINISQSIPVTLYFIGQTDDNQTYYVPVTRMINRTEQVAEAALKELIKGPKQQSDLVSSLDSSLQVNKIQQTEQMVIADFNEHLLQYNQQSQASKDAIETILLSLTENTSKEKVSITVNGKKIQGDVPQPITRPKTINPSKL